MGHCRAAASVRQLLRAAVRRPAATGRNQEESDADDDEEQANRGPWPGIEELGAGGGGLQKTAIGAQLARAVTIEEGDVEGWKAEPRHQACKSGTGRLAPSQQHCGQNSHRENEQANRCQGDGGEGVCDTDRKPGRERAPRAVARA